VVVPEGPVPQAPTSATPVSEVPAENPPPERIHGGDNWLRWWWLNIWPNGDVDRQLYRSKAEAVDGGQGREVEPMRVRFTRHPPA